MSLLARVNTGNQMNCQNIIFIIAIDVCGYKIFHINGIRGLTNDYFAFYIIDRKQYTSINGFNSNLTSTYGLPKDLVSGRHLFLTYTGGTGKK